MKTKLLFVFLFLATLTFASICFAETNNKNTDSIPAGSTLTFNLGDGISFDMVYCPAGTFTMGCPDEKYIKEYYHKYCFIKEFLGNRIINPKMAKLVQYNENPHKVTITKPFYIGKFEVTQKLYEYIMGKDENLSKFKGPNRPVESVSYESIALGRENSYINDTFVFGIDGKVTGVIKDAVIASATPGFLNGINALLANQIPAGYKFDLPTEAQWEYACKAGTNKSFIGNCNEIAWYDKNSNATTHDVGQKKPNDWGIYDMLGNVKEMCRDKYKFYKSEDLIDPKNDENGDRICRGGSFNSVASCCRSSVRSRTYTSNAKSYDLGFRLALVKAEEALEYKPVHFKNKKEPPKVSVPDEVIFDD